jgi:hypothetical protein
VNSISTNVSINANPPKLAPTKINDTAVFYLSSDLHRTILYDNAREKTYHEISDTGSNNEDFIIKTNQLLIIQELPFCNVGTLLYI